MILKTYKHLPAIKQKHKKQKIVFCSGAFDLTHAGHVLFFESCKELGHILVVGVGSDYMIHRNKAAKRPVLNEYVRLLTVDALRPVDYCFIDKSTPKDHPLAVVEATFKYLKPDIYVINQDAFDIPYREMLSKKYGVRLAILDRTCPPEFENISTTSLIEKIKKLGSKN